MMAENESSTAKWHNHLKGKTLARSTYNKLITCCYCTWNHVQLGMRACISSCLSIYRELICNENEIVSPPHMYAASQGKDSFACKIEEAFWQPVYHFNGLRFKTKKYLVFKYTMFYCKKSLNMPWILSFTSSGQPFSSSTARNGAEPTNHGWCPAGGGSVLSQ